MTLNQRALAGAALALVLAGGCRASLEGKRLSRTPSSDNQSGITYYLIEPAFSIDVKDRHDGKPAEPVYDIKVGFAADEDQRYAVRLKGGTITNDLLNLKLRPDGTLVSLGSKSESRLPELVSSLGSFVAAGLRFAALGVPAVAALAEGEDPFLEILQTEGVCKSAITLQDLSDAVCIKQLLIEEKNKCTKPPDFKCGEELQSTIEPSDSARQLAPAALDKALGLAQKLIPPLEDQLWRQLDADTSLGTLGRNAVLNLIRIQVFRAFEDTVANQRGVSPRHLVLAPPDPTKVSTERIARNLDALIGAQVRDVVEAPAEEVKGEANRLALLAEIAGAFADLTLPGALDADRRLAAVVTRLEARIVKRFADGDFSTEEKAGEAEKASLDNYRLVRQLQDVRETLTRAKPPVAVDQIRRDLARKRARADQRFAEYVAGTISRADFENTLKTYADAVARLLERDDRLGAAPLSLRRDRLAEVVARKIPGPVPQDKASTAYRAYREELDRIAGEIGTRLAIFQDAKKAADPLPRGTQTSRTLVDVVSCVIGNQAQLFDSDSKLLTLAEIWIRYGGKESVVFRSRAGASGDRLDCDGSTFGASARKQRSCIEVGAVERPSRQRPGMHVRRLTATNKAVDKDKTCKEHDETLLEGVLVQVPAPYDVVAVLLDASRERVLKATTLSLPADDEFLDIGFKGSLFRSQELTLGFHPNGAIDEYKLDSKEKVSDSTKSLGDATKAITDSLLEIEEAKQQPAPTDPLQDENDQLLLQTINLMLAANAEAIREGRPLPYPQVLDFLQD